MPTLARPPSITPAQAETVVRGLRDASYARALAAIAEEVGRDLPARTRRAALRYWQGREGLTAGELLALLLWEGMTVKVDSLDPGLVEAFESADLIQQIKPNEYASRVRVVDFGGLLLLADRASEAESTVMSPSPATGLLAALMPQNLSGVDVLEVCAGAAPLALTAAARGARAVAADLNPRCAAFAELNSTLNKLEVDVRTGHLFEPVAGEQFDVVVAQPPYIEQPEAVDHITFMHSGPTGEDLSMQLLAGLPNALRVGGEALLTFHAYGDANEISHKVDEALGVELQVTLFCAPSSNAFVRATELAAMHDPGEGEAFEAALSRYLSHLDRLGREGKGVIARIRRHDPATESGWLMVCDATGSWITRNALEAYERAGALLADSDVALDSATMRFPPGAQLVAERTLESGSVAHRLQFSQTSFAVARDVPTRMLPLVEAFAHGAPVHVAIEALARQRGVPVAAVAHEAKQFVREYLVSGALVVDE